MNEQELLLTKVKKCGRIDLYVDPNPLTNQEEAQLARMNDRLSQGEPLQYILGTTEFMGLEFRVDPRVFIPRPETELLVEFALQILGKKSNKGFEILDIGTGSGNISVSIARRLPAARVTALDISQDALDLASRNAGINGVAEQIHFIKSDVRGACRLARVAPEAARPLFDLIISNPPYIRTTDLALLPQDVRHEPKIALDGGWDGLNFYRRIIAESVDFLKPGGGLLFEMGDGQRPAIEKIFISSGVFKVIAVKQDYRQTDRIILAELGHG